VMGFVLFTPLPETRSAPYSSCITHLKAKDNQRSLHL